MSSTSARRVAWLSAAALGLWACSHAPSPVEQATSTSSGGSGATGGVGGVGGTGGSTSSGGSGATGGGAGSGGGTVVGDLVDRDLVTRYYIDEADSGQGPTELVDAAPDPLPLALTWIPEMSFTEDDDGHRGLQWTAIELDGRASVAVDTTKISANLHGSTTGTIEIVAEVLAVSSSSSRLSHIGFDSETGSFTLAAQSVTRVAFRSQDSLKERAEHDWVETGRCVVHGVFDSTQADAAERVKIYVNGAALPWVEGTPPDQDEAIDLGTGRHFALGNREIGGRSFVGTLYYAAMYGTALTVAEVLQNTGVLLIDDDTPSR